MNNVGSDAGGRNGLKCHHLRHLKHLEEVDLCGIVSIPHKSRMGTIAYHFKGLLYSYVGYVG